jgi:hypothetical protein
MKHRSGIKNRFSGRRQFLMGAGASFLLLPPLRSLMLPSAAAQAAAPKKRFVVYIGTNGVDQQHLNPVNQNDLTSIAGAYSAGQKPLSAFGGPISRMIDSDFVSMYPKMNVIQGLSMVGGNGYFGHNTCLLAGAQSPYDSGDTAGFTTLDVVMERSTAVYPIAVPFKAVRVGTGQNGGRDDRSFSFHGATTSDVLLGDTPMFNMLFAQLTGSSPTSNDDKLIVDKVYADLKALQVNPKLSSKDKVVLDQFVSGIVDLQKKVQSQVVVSCNKPSLSLQASKNAYYLAGEEWGNPPSFNSSLMFDNINTMIQLAFACDLTRIAYIGNARCNHDGNVSDDNHHGAPGGSEGAADLQKWGLKKFLKLAQLLDSTPDGSGAGSLLDSSGMLWTNELGDWTTDHNINSMPTVTFGSLGGTLRTGHFMDFRQRPFRDAGTGYPVGRPHKQLLQAFMQGMGVTKAEYMTYGTGQGFGEFSNIAHGQDVFGVYKNEHNDALPFFKL